MSERRAVLITGGAKGIGRGIALDRAAEGWDMALCYRTSGDAAEQTKRDVEARGAGCLVSQTDVSDPAAVEALVAEVVDRFGRLDAIVNGAGPYHRAKLLDETPESWRSMFANNLDSVFYTARFGAPHMIERGWGRIVSFSMANADHVKANTAVTAHFIAKMGVQALTRALAKELAIHGVTANTLSPGFLDSGSAPEEELAKMTKRIPAKRVGTVEDAVAAARYLMSDEASYVTGTNLVISGGWGL